MSEKDCKGWAIQKALEHLANGNYLKGVFEKTTEAIKNYDKRPRILERGDTGKGVYYP